MKIMNTVQFGLVAESLKFLAPISQDLERTMIYKYAQSFNDELLEGGQTEA